MILLAHGLIEDARFEDSSLVEDGILSTPGFALGVADQISSALWREHVGNAITQPQFLALSELHHNPGIGHLELAERIGVDKVTIGPIIKKLTEQNSIERGTDKADARRSVLRITNEGTHTLMENAAAADRMTEELMSPLSITEQAVVLQAWATMARLASPHHGLAAMQDPDGSAVPSSSYYPWYFVRIARRSFRRIWRDAVGDDISASQFAIMEAIRHTQPIDIRTAAAQAYVEETTAVRIIMRGIRLRTFKDRRDPEDARRSLLSLTAVGGEEFERIAMRLAEIQAALCEGIPKRIFPEVHRLTRIVARLEP